MANPAGYSGTPLAKKLGIASGMRVCTKNAPEGYPGWLEPLPDDVTFESTITKDTGLLHMFADRKSAMAKELATARKKLHVAATVWVSWPKKASKVPTDI